MASPRLSKVRIFWLFGFLLILLVSLSFRLAYLQFFHPRQFAERARNQAEHTQEIPPFRGIIYDRNGEELALDIQAKSLWANPREIGDMPQTIQKLESALALDKDYLENRLYRDKGFVWIDRKLSDETVRRIEGMKLQGLYLKDEWQRVYPNASSASHIIGLTGMDHAGLEGIEYRYESYLKGVPGWKTIRLDAKRREVVSREEALALPVDGFDIYLALDIVIQHAADRELQAACQKFNAKAGSVIVMNPENGDILALANYPNFDPMKPETIEADALRNRAITDMYEPGSVFKIVTLAAALEEKIMGLEDEIYCEQGEYRTGGRILHDTHPYGKLSLENVIVKSSNIGTVKTAEALGKKRLNHYIKRFGFGEKTQVELTGEISGLVRAPKHWSGTSISSISIGQEVGVTALQMTNAFQAIANDGLLMKPRSVLKVVDSQGEIVREFSPQVRRRVISPETARQVQNVMEKVILEGTGQRARVEGITLGGKTGTAQKLDENGVYSHEHFVASFGGFMRQEGKRAVIMVVIDDPQPLYYGGTVAAPVFGKIAQYLANYWELTHKESLEVMAS